MEEEFCSDGQLLVAVNGDGNVCGIQRLGSSAVEPEMMTEMLEVHLYLHTKLSWHLAKCYTIHT
jgi:exosome complex RNA-binding protein Rrp42 (RNase PH superfamily)